MEPEIWKSPVNFSNYEVSNYGRIRSLNYNHTGKTKLLTLGTVKNGYRKVILFDDDRKKHYLLVHRIVAEVFIPNPNKYPVVNHKNEVVDDNRVENLEWCTVKYNNNYGTRMERVAESLRRRHPKKEKKPVIKTIYIVKDIITGEIFIGDCKSVQLHLNWKTNCLAQFVKEGWLYKKRFSFSIQPTQ